MAESYSPTLAAAQARIAAALPADIRQGQSAAEERGLLLERAR